MVLWMQGVVFCGRIAGLQAAATMLPFLRLQGLYQRLSNHENLPQLSTEINGVQVPSIMLGDSAFPHNTWLLKPYSHAVLLELQSYFNY